MLNKIQTVRRKLEVNECLVLRLSSEMGVHTAVLIIGADILLPLLFKMSTLCVCICVGGAGASTACRHLAGIPCDRVTKEGEH